MDNQHSDTTEENELREVESKDDGNSVESMTAVENLIKRKLSQIEELREVGGTYKEMVDGFLENDEEFIQLSDNAKEAARAKGARKKELLGKQEISATVEKLRENQAELKELKQSLSANLSDFQRLSGASQIELEAGDLRQIVYVAKLVKRSQQG